MRVVAPDPRCAITAVDPDTGGERLRRPENAVELPSCFAGPYFGVYGVVENPGMVSLGDEVEVVVPPLRR